VGRGIPCANLDEALARLKISARLENISAVAAECIVHAHDAVRDNHPGVEPEYDFLESKTKLREMWHRHKQVYVNVWASGRRRCRLRIHLNLDGSGSVECEYEFREYQEKIEGKYQPFKSSWPAVK
jgi:hypothetical protein